MITSAAPRFIVTGRFSLQNQPRVFEDMTALQLAAAVTLHGDKTGLCGLERDEGGPRPMPNLAC